jgi:hypothetical protein
MASAPMGGQVILESLEGSERSRSSTGSSKRSRSAPHHTPGETEANMSSASLDHLEVLRSTSRFSSHRDRTFASRVSCAHCARAKHRRSSGPALATIPSFVRRDYGAQVFPTDRPQIASSRETTPRATVIAGRNRGGTREAAFFRMNFSLEVTTPRRGITHGTVRCEPTPRVRTVSTFPITQATGSTDSSKRANPNRLEGRTYQWPVRLDQPMEGRNSREDQGGPQ